MIFVTGDTHGDFTRFSTHSFPEQRQLTKDDYVIVCGDFGIWDGSKQEQYWLDWLNDKPFTNLFVDGNHSNFDLLGQLPVGDWRGGNVHVIRDSVLHLMRGQVFVLAGKRIFTMGGASSHDIDDGILEPGDPDFKRRRRQLEKRRAHYRINHISWWREELPSDEDYETARRNLDACGWKVDWIVSHCCPSGMVDIVGGERYGRDRLTDFFEEIRERCDFDYWFFGHYHGNRVLMQRYILLYEQILQADPPK
ncbi:MAG: metallophosphatase [Clostridiales bacterium]|nr:metallophosphatase [Clostridiales bacterium]